MSCRNISQREGSQSNKDHAPSDPVRTGFPEQAAPQTRQVGERLSGAGVGGEQDELGSQLGVARRGDELGSGEGCISLLCTERLYLFKGQILWYVNYISIKNDEK